MSNRIHVLIHGEQFGPYPEAEFQQHVADRKILRSDLVWRQGLADWIPAAELLEQLRPVAPAPAVATASPALRGSSFDQLRQAATQGDPEAQFQLSLLHFAG